MKESNTRRLSREVDSQPMLSAWYREPLLVSIFSLVAIVLLAVILVPDATKTYLGFLHATMIDTVGIVYGYLGIIVVLLCVVMMILPVGKRRMGGQDAVPDYSYLSWLAMLFSTGMGSGLLLRAVQEPVFYWVYHPDDSLNRKRLALEYSFFHWGITAWAFYALFAVVLMGIMFRSNGLALLSQFFVSSPQKTPSHKRTYPYWWIDVLVVFGTLMGVLTSLGLSSQQTIQGFLSLLPLDVSSQGEMWLWSLCVIFVSVGAWVSAYVGLQRGIQRLSALNIILSVALLFWVMSHYDVGTILWEFVSHVVWSFRDWWAMSLARGPFNVPDAFLHDWTYFYWAWWLAWAPFTGIFIARISRGRTLRECLLNIILVPSLASMLWFTVFTHASLEQIGRLGSYDGRFDDAFSSIFVFFSAFEGSGFIYIVLLTLLITYLITSLDSALFILGMSSSHGMWNPPKSHIIFWSTVIPLVCLGVGWLGRDHLLKTLSQILVLTSFPVSILLAVIICMMLWMMCRSKFHRCDPHR